MKKFWKIFLMISVAFAIIYDQLQKLPYDLRFTKIDTEYYIHDEGGHMILAEGYDVNYDENRPKVKEMIQYSKNKIGLVVMVQCEDNQKYYVVIKPKSEQNYLPELEVDYSIYSSVDYNRLEINDLWFKVRWW